MAVADATIFVVDDNEAVRDSLTLLLQAYGMRVESYASSEEFARRYQPTPCACLILDHHLPGMTGVEFLASRPASTLGLPVILLSAEDSAVIETRAIGTGIFAYLMKPVDAASLIGAITQALQQGCTCQP